MNQRDCKITMEEFMGLGFSEAQDSVWGSCWKSLQKYVPPTPMVHLGDSEREEIERGFGTPRFIYVNRQGRVVDRQDYNRQGYVEDIYDLADFMLELKEFPREGKQLSHNKGLYEQMQNGFIHPYTTSLTLDDIRRAFEAGDRERQSERRIQMQTGVEGMRVFNQSLLQEMRDYSPIVVDEISQVPGIDGQPFTVRLDRNDFAQATNYGRLQSMNVWRTDTDGLEITG